MASLAGSQRQRGPYIAHRAIAFADIVNSTALVEEHEVEAFRRVRRILAMLRRNARSFDGRIVDEAGDGALASFACAHHAVEWAEWCHAAAQGHGHRRAATNSMPLRIGIHAGPILICGSRLFGRNVVVACRLQQMAQPGETLVSTSVKEALLARGRNSITSLGELPLRGLSAGICVYRLDASLDRGSLDVVEAMACKLAASALP
jgi:class 3 adenylate cyclase